MAQPRLKALIITDPDKLDHPWITRLADEVELCEKVGLINQATASVMRHQPEVVLIEREIEQIERTTRQILVAAPETYCVALVPNPDMATLRRLMASGVRDVIASPPNSADLNSTLDQARQAVAERRRLSQNAVAEIGLGKVIVVSAPKGGVGTTFIAVNLALALQNISGAPVALVDCSLQFGDVGVHLNLRSRHTIADLAGQVEVDSGMLQRVLTVHESGLNVLLAPSDPDSAAHISGQTVAAVVERLRRNYAYVVIDTWSFLDEITETLLNKADHVLLVTTPELPALKNTKRLVEVVVQRKLAPEKIQVVLNRFPSVEGISLEDVQQHLHYPVAANIPSEGLPVTHSINRGQPLVLAQPQSWTANSMRRLAAHLAGEEIETITMSADEARSDRRKGKGGSGLMRFIRRTT